MGERAAPIIAQVQADVRDLVVARSRATRRPEANSLWRRFEMATKNPARTWTYEDLFTLPDDGKRYEIIEGELFEMPAANSEHAIAIANLMFMLGPVVRSLGGLILTAPLDVFLRGANPVQPDVVVLLADRLHQISKRGIEGPPNLLMEVLSPSNPDHDRIRKRLLYARGGVDEYWLVDPEARTIDVLMRDGDAFRLLVRASGDELVRSAIFPDLSFPASAVFSIGSRR
jgi:Uma2 family endonuclease